MVRRTASWYEKHLEAYFKEHYIFHERVIERVMSSEPNKLIFNIPVVNIRIVLTCDDGGNVTEKRLPMERRRGPYVNSDCSGQASARFGYIH